MGGNSPSHLSQGGAEGGGVVFVQGIRLSDRVITRMKQSPPPQEERPPSRSPDTRTSTLVSAPSVEHLLPLFTPPPSPTIIPTNPAFPQETPATPPSAEPVRIFPPPPVKFHSLPPSSVATPPPVETKNPPQINSTSPPAKSTPSHAEPASSPPSAVVPPPPEFSVPPALEPESPSTTPVAEHATSSPPPVKTAPSEPLASSVPSDLEKPAAVEPATVAPTVLETVVPSSPSVPALHPPSPARSTAAEPIIPCSVSSAPAEALPPQAEPTGPPAVAPALDSANPCELVSAPPPPDMSPAPDLTFEEFSLPCHSAELAVIPAEETIMEPVAPPPPGPSTPAVEPIVTPPLPPVDDLPQCAAVLPDVSPDVLEENLRLKIKEEMQRSLEEEINQKRQELQRQLEEVRAQARAEAKAAAQAQVEEQVKKILAAEKTAYMENLTDSITKEQKKTEDENLLVQLYWIELKARQLEEKEKELKKRDTLYKEHVSKLEAKCTQFYKVTAESFQKGKEETHHRFARFHIQPVCGDLQSQILNCYQENTGRTLSCSKLASAYMQCVDKAKKNKLSTGG